MVGYDGSEPATGALRFAAARAGEDGRILVVYAVQPSDDAWRGTSTYAQLRARSAEEAEAAVLDRARRELSSSKVEGYWILEGAAAPALRETAVAFKADEIVVGSRGLSRLRTSLGSVCHALLPGLDRSLTVVTPAAAQQIARSFAIRTIVAGAAPGYDQPWVGDAAARTARDVGARLIVAGVDDVARGTIGPVPRTVYRAEAQAAAQRLAGRIRPYGVQAEVVVRSGSVPAELEALAEGADADLLVVGATARGHLAEGVLGSVPRTLIERSRRPLTIVPDYDRGGN